MGKKTAYKSTTFAHPNLQSTSPVSKNITYKSTTFGVCRFYNEKRPTIYDPPPP